MKKLIFITLALSAVLSFSSCARRLTDFTVISTKNVPVGDGIHSDFQKGTKRVKGEDVSHMVLCFPLGYPNMKEAIDKAIESQPGAIGLVDGVIKSGGWTCLLYGQNKYVVEGTPLFPTDYDYESENSGRPRKIKSSIERNQQPAMQQRTIEQTHDNTEKESESLMFFHKVKRGEDLASIAKQYNVSLGDIIRWNKLNSNAISEGEKLIIHIK